MKGLQEMLNLGRAIKLIRSARGKSLADVAERSGTSVPFLSLVEGGDRQPSLATLRKISEALEIPPEVLILVASEGAGTLRTDDGIAAGLADALARVAAAEVELKRRLEDSKR
jgi:transcriptional regulator with XRE-family HTH domain